MQDTLISFETAVLAKEKGFDIPVNTLYQHNGNMHEVLPSDNYPHLAHYREHLDDYTTGFYNWNKLELDDEEKLNKVSGFSESDEDWFTVKCSAPTQSLLQKYLWEKHGYWVEVLMENSHSTNFYYCIYRTFKDGLTTLVVSTAHQEHNKDPYDVLEKGLFATLKLIKDDKI